ncbi:MAG: lysylphosphatidylglycerol synthase domain-containing protein [Dongiaceae bacterium]
MSVKAIRWLSFLMVVALFGGAMWLLYHQLHKHSWEDFEAAILAIGGRDIVMACVFTLLSYIVLAGYDFSALYYLQRRLPSRGVFLASFTGFAFSQNLALSPLTGGAVRLRIYSAYGVPPLEIGKLVAFCILTFSIGATAVGGTMMVIEPELMQPLDHLPIEIARLIGIVTLLGIAGYIYWASHRKTPIRFRGFEFKPLSTKLAVWQILLAAIDLALVSAVLYVLLPTQGTGVTFLYVFGVYVVAITFGILSHVPGSLGVFDSIVILLLEDRIETPYIVGAILLYRLIYLLIPLLAASLTLALFEWRNKREKPAILAAPGNGITPQQNFINENSPPAKITDQKR